MRLPVLRCFVLLFFASGVALLAANLPLNRLPKAARADRVVVDKSARRLTLFLGARPIKTYRIALGHSPIGQKHQEGDQRTPEGNYTLDRHKPDSAFHLALHISYPRPEDAAAAANDGVEPGGDIMIHGLPNGVGWIGRFHRLKDWTAGCVAVTDKEIEEISRAVEDGTPIQINP